MTEKSLFGLYRKVTGTTKVVDSINDYYDQIEIAFEEGKNQVLTTPGNILQKIKLLQAGFDVTEVTLARHSMTPIFKWKISW